MQYHWRRNYSLCSAETPNPVDSHITSRIQEMDNTNPRGAFTHPLGPRYVPLLLVYPPRPLRTFASLNAHLQVHLGLGGKPRSGLRPHSLNRAASPCCGLRTSSGRFDALAVQRKAMRCPAALRGIGAPSGFDPRALCSARYAAARRTVAVVGNVLPL